MSSDMSAERAAKRARWAIYDLVAMRTEIGGRGYGL
jgi:hypothetical protein